MEVEVDEKNAYSNTFAKKPRMREGRAIVPAHRPVPDVHSAILRSVSTYTSAGSPSRRYISSISSSEMTVPTS